MIFASKGSGMIKVSEQGLVRRLRAPSYWMSGSSDGHEGENEAPREAADRIERLEAALRDVRAEAAKGAVAGPVRLARIHGLARAALRDDAQPQGSNP